MKKLLEELKQLDPACYDEIWQWALWLEEEGGFAADDPVYLKHRNDVIQGACQRAIAARGWHWLLEDGDPVITKGLFQCDIFDSGYNALKCYIGGDSPAKAILTCYLAAMKAQP